MNTETSTETPQTPIAVLDAAPPVKEQPDVVSASQTPPASSTAPGATAASPSNATPPPLERTAAAINQTIRLSQFNRQRRRFCPATVAKPRIGEHDLHIEGSLKVVNRTGTVFEIQLDTMLPGAVAPHFVSVAQEQFEGVLNQLLIKPATIAFIGHLEDVKATRKAAAEKAKQASALEKEANDAELRNMLNKQ